MVRLVVRGELRVSKVQITMRVFHQMYMGILEMENVLMIEVICLSRFWGVWRFLGCRSRWGLLCWFFISNFEIFFNFKL